MKNFQKSKLIFKFALVNELESKKNLKSYYVAKYYRLVW